MDKKEYKNGQEKFKVKQKELKFQYKAERIPFKERASDRLVSLAISFNDARKKIGNKVHAKKTAIKDLKKKVDYIVDSLKATLGTDDEIRAKTIEDIIEHIDDL